MDSHCPHDPEGKDNIPESTRSSLHLVGHIQSSKNTTLVRVWPGIPPQNDSGFTFSLHTHGRCQLLLSTFPVEKSSCPVLMDTTTPCHPLLPELGRRENYGLSTAWRDSGKRKKWLVKNNQAVDLQAKPCN